jgi:hypothetical protein
MYPLPSSIAQDGGMNYHPTAAASINLNSTFTDVSLPVTLSYTLAEYKRLVLAFESRI